jgi:arsenite methyltransferase
MKDQIRARYGEAARRVSGAIPASCCGPTAWRESEITSNLYQLDEVQDLPAKAVLASLGCGNPTALLELVPGETVLDLGSGGGIDVLLSARRVGPTGKAYGLDMTDEMLALARRNQQEAGATNVEFLKGDIEQIPLPDSHVDVIISNCVVNLATDKDQVFREAFRVLKPGGRFAVSDVVFQGAVDQLGALRQNVEAWAGCVAGALEEQDYITRLQAAGFTDVSVEVTRVYSNGLLGGSCCGEGQSVAALPEGVRLVSGFVRARKPGAGECTVRGARPEDLPSVRRLLKEAKLPLDGLEEQFGPGYAVAEAGGRIIGAEGLEVYGSHGLLRSAVVDSAWRGLGIGEALTRNRLAWAKEQELQSVWLLTTTASDYFPQFGFVRADRQAAPADLQQSVEFAHACPASAVTMFLPM